MNAEGTDVTDSIKQINVQAITPIIGISLENDIKNESVGIANKNEFGKISFGLIKPAPTTTNIEKKITNVKLITQLGTSLVSANPIDKTQNYVTALDNILGGSEYVKVEIDPDNIYGSNLETTYEVTVKNESAKDYIENIEESNSEYGTYYKYGIITNNAVLKKVKINEVLDSLDQKYNVKSLPETVSQTITKSNTKKEGRAVSIIPDTKTTKIKEKDGSEKKITEVKLSGWEDLETSETTTINYTVTSLLSKDDDDTKYENGTKITSISLDKLTTLKSNLGEAKLTTISITPTTGKNKNIIHIFLIAICLIVLGIGTIVIRKKIVNRS